MLRSCPLHQYEKSKKWKRVKMSHLKVICVIRQIHVKKMTYLEAYHQRGIHTRRPLFKKIFSQSLLLLLNLADENKTFSHGPCHFS